MKLFLGLLSLSLIALFLIIRNPRYEPFVFDSADIVFDPDFEGSLEHYYSPNDNCDPTGYNYYQPPCDLRITLVL
jgi:hypothetical protein